MKKFWKEFKEFINRGNVVDLAVAVIIGGAFGKIVTSLVNDIITPIIGILIGNVSLSDLKWVIKNGTETTNELAICYGNFLQTMFDFVIIAFCMFLAIKIFMESKKRLEDATNRVVTEFRKLTRKEKKKLKKEQKLAKKNDVLSESATENEQKSEQQILAKETAPVEQANPPVESTTPPTEQSSVELLKEIRDLLKQNNNK